MNLPVEEAKKLNDGVHTGVIVGIEEREKPYHYADVIIETEGMKVKIGFPACIMPESKLGMLLTRFGKVLVFGEDINLDTELIGKRCTFQSITEGKYYKCIGESLKPVVVEEVV